MTINDTSQLFIKDLTEKFLSEILQQAHNEAVNSIREKLNQFNISLLLQEQINNVVIPFFSEELQKKLESDVTERLSEIDVTSLVNRHLINVIIPRMESQAKEKLAAEVVTRLQTINVAEIANQYTAKLIRDSIKTMHFPDHSIPGKAIKPDSLTISADKIEGGIIKNFESTGIQDSATRCQVTILDQATVFENKLVSRGLEIVGATTLKGNVTIEGNISENSQLVQQLVKIVSDKFSKEFENGTFDQYSDRVFERLIEEGIDATLIKIGEEAIAIDNTLNGTITNSNLQKLGALKELQVIGETLLDQTLYVSGQRVGINTISPERALDLWDQEIQIVAGKRQKDVAFLGTGRNQTLIIGTNNRDQLTVNTDGSVSVTSLNIGRINHTSASRMPTDNRPIGQIVWNEQPIVGSAVGWVSLGGARWASFGLITG